MEQNANNLLIEEWKEIRSSVKYFGNMRFAQLTVYMAASGFLFKQALALEYSLYQLLVSVIGISLSAIFALLEKRHKEYWDSFIERGSDIEKELGTIELISKCRPNGENKNDNSDTTKSVSGTQLMYTLYLGAIVVWCVFIANCCRSYFDL